MRLLNASNGSVLATDVDRATNAWTRGVGLLPRGHVGPHEGLWIGGCSAIHTIGMRATIDCYFLDADDRVLKIASAVTPSAQAGESERRARASTAAIASSALATLAPASAPVWSGLA
ncbi:MAG: hypothetical protein NVS2B3_05180 [Vulcanimicrobiaceae bacterium]